MKKMTVITLLLAAAICSACGNTDSPESAPQPDTVTASVTLPAPESDPDKKSETDSETAPEELPALTDDRKSETKETTTETEDSEIEDTTETAETTAEKATTTSKAVTSSATTTTKKATTTTKAVAQTTTTTKKAATTTTTAKQATTTTTTTKTTTTTTQAASTVEWTPLMRAYQHYREATLDCVDDASKYDKSIFTDAEVELIRKDICDYGLKNFNGKQVVTLHTENGIKTLDFLRPLELTVDTALYCYKQGSFVLGDAHLNCGGGQGYIYVPKKQYLAMSDEEKYNIALDDMQGAHDLMENALYRWYNYLAGNNEEKYAYLLTYNFGITPDGEYWFLNK